MILGVFLILCAVLCVYPILYIVFASFSDPMQLTLHTGALFYPLDPSLGGYKVALSYKSIGTGYYTTIKIVIAGTILNMIVTTMAAYAVSRKDVFFWKFMNLISVITMFFSGGLVPFYLVVKNLGLLDNLGSLILPAALSTWNMIILRVSIQSLPAELFESARIDGASDYVVMLRIVVPLVKATMAVLAFYTIVGHWNSWFNAMLFIKSRNKFPLQLVLREILVLNSSTQNMAVRYMDDLSAIDRYKQLVKYCTTVIATLPIMFIFPFFQKYFVKGVLIGSLKG
jgi:putative aldouronate transport system permease protein